MKQENNTTVDISALSNKELKELEKQIKLRRNAEAEERARLAEVKANYKLNLPEPKDIKFMVNCYRIVSDLVREPSEIVNGELWTDGQAAGTREYVENLHVVSKDRLLKIIRRYIDMVSLANSDNWEWGWHRIYTCPHCGTSNLELLRRHLGERHGESQWGDYYVKCTNCKWEAPKKASDCYKDGAWEAFHSWLIKEGFLPEGTEFPEKTLEAALKENVAENIAAYLERFI